MVPAADAAAACRAACHETCRGGFVALTARLGNSIFRRRRPRHPVERLGESVEAGPHRADLRAEERVAGSTARRIGGRRRPGTGGGKPPRPRRLRVEPSSLVEHHRVETFRRLPAHQTLRHVRRHRLRATLQRVAVAAPARGLEDEPIALRDGVLPLCRQAAVPGEGRPGQGGRGRRPGGPGPGTSCAPARRRR